MSIAIAMLVLWNLYHGHELVKAQQRTRALELALVSLEDDFYGEDEGEDAPEETPAVESEGA